MRKSSLIAAIVCLAATPALAVDANFSVKSPVAPAKLWKAVGGFCGIANWHPALASCKESKDGTVTTRLLTLKGGGEIKEKLDEMNDSGMSYTYSIISSPLPVANYTSTIAVKPAGEGSELVWTGHFDAKGASDAEAKKVIEGIYAGGANNLVKTTQ